MLQTLAEIFQGRWPPIRVALRRYGVLKITLTLTLFSILLSMLISTVIMLLTDGSISIIGLFISIIVPAIIAPLFEYRLLSVLFRLDIAEEKLKITTTMDDLTNTFNRRYFFEIADQELARTQRHGGTFSIAILDFDNFKNINDNYGHQAGDQALRELSRICSDNIHLPHLFARYGGDEFVFLFPESNKEKATNCLNRIFTDISNFSLDLEGSQVKIRVSMGIAEFSREEPFIDHILKEADTALYRAKHDGGNKIG